MDPKLLVPFIIAVICQLLECLCVICYLIVCDFTGESTNIGLMWVTYTIGSFSVFIMLMSILYAHYHITKHIYDKLKENTRDYKGPREISKPDFDKDNNTSNLIDSSEQMADELQLM